MCYSSHVLFVQYGREIKQRNQKTLECWIRWLYSFNGDTKIGLISCNVIARQFLLAGAPKTTATEDIVIKIHDLVLADHRLKACEIAEIVGISKDRVGHILHEILGIRKLSARWMTCFSLRTTLATVRPLQTVCSQFGHLRNLFVSNTWKSNSLRKKFQSNVMGATEACFEDLNSWIIPGWSVSS